MDYRSFLHNMEIDIYLSNEKNHIEYIMPMGKGFIGKSSNSLKRLEKKRTHRKNYRKICLCIKILFIEKGTKVPFFYVSTPELTA